MEAIALTAQPTWKPEVACRRMPRWFSPPLYGMKTYGDLFTPRQLVALTTFSDLVQEARERVKRDALAVDLPDDGRALENGGVGATAYADAVAVFLGFSGSRMADRHSSLCRWDPNPSGYARKLLTRSDAKPCRWCGTMPKAIHLAHLQAIYSMRLAGSRKLSRHRCQPTGLVLRCSWTQHSKM